MERYQTAIIRCFQVWHDHGAWGTRRVVQCFPTVGPRHPREPGDVWCAVKNVAISLYWFLMERLCFERRPSLFSSGCWCAMCWVFFKSPIVPRLNNDATFQQICRGFEFIAMQCSNDHHKGTFLVGQCLVCGMRVDPWCLLITLISSGNSSSINWEMAVFSDWFRFYKHTAKKTKKTNNLTYLSMAASSKLSELVECSFWIASCSW